MYVHLSASGPLTCVFFYMSGLVSMSNDPAHQYIYIQALTVHLFVFVTAPWWLLFSPFWGDEGDMLGKSGREACSEEMCFLQSL